jgi:hypothetical protein
VNVFSAGTLSTLLSSNELNKITNLTLTGSIDARDFVFLRDKMTKLSVLNLSSANIKLYYGINGTYSGISLLYPANELPMYAFYNDNTSTYKSTLTSVSLPNTISSIGYLAFYYCYNLTGTFSIPASVKSIADYALYGCTSISAYAVETANTRYSSSDGMLLSKAQDSIFICPTKKTGSISIPQTVKWIGYSAFEGCSLLTGPLNFPASLKTIESFAFYYCSGLTGNLTIPSNVSKVGESAFYGCSGFNGSLTIPAALNDLGASPFFLCDNLQNINVNASNPKYASIDGVMYSKNIDSLLICPGGKTGTITIPNQVKVIGDYSFYNCKNVSGTLNIAANIYAIGDYAFFGTQSISEFTVSTSNTNFTSVDGVLFTKTKTTLLACPGSKTGIYTIPSGVQKIAAGAFNNCSSLTGSIQIPASVTQIGDYAFYACSSIDGFEVEAGNLNFASENDLLYTHARDSLLICPTSKSGVLYIPNNVTYIGYSSFEGCINLTELILAKSVTTIDNYAFQDCIGLTRIRLSTNLKTIGTAAFYNCSSLQKIETESSIPQTIEYYTFDQVDKNNCVLYVPIGSIANYQNATYWSDFTNITEKNFDDTAINDLTPKVRITTSKDRIIINGLQMREKIAIYTINGLLIKQFLATQSTEISQVASSGVYIVIVSGFAQKISL